jgi:hypothetical protein
MNKSKKPNENIKVPTYDTIIDSYSAPKHKKTKEPEPLTNCRREEGSSYCISHKNKCKEKKIEFISYSEFEKKIKKEQIWNKQHPKLASLKTIYYWFKYLPYRSYILFRYDLLRYVVSFFQRGIRGWANCDTWSFYRYHARICKEALIHMKKVKHGYPSYFKNENEWNKVLNKMICAFTLIDSEKEEYPSNNKLYKKYRKFCMTSKETIRVKEGLLLFITYYRGLWD